MILYYIARPGWDDANALSNIAQVTSPDRTLASASLICDNMLRLAIPAILPFLVVLCMLCQLPSLLSSETSDHWTHDFKQMGEILQQLLEATQSLKESAEFLLQVTENVPVEGLDKYREKLSPEKIDAIMTEVQTLQNTLKSRKLKIVVVGPISAGKSSLVNALLRTDFKILPSLPGPTTYCTVVLTGTEKDTATAYMPDGQEFPVKQVNTHCDEVNEERSAKVTFGSAIRIDYPRSLCPLLAPDVELWDTPGLVADHEGKEPVIRKISNDASVVLMVVDAAARGISPSEQRFLKELHTLGSTLVIYNKWDLFLEKNKESQTPDKRAKDMRSKYLEDAMVTGSDGQSQITADRVFFADTESFIKDKGTKAGKEYVKMESTLRHFIQENILITSLLEKTSSAVFAVEALAEQVENTKKLAVSWYQNETIILLELKTLRNKAAKLTEEVISNLEGQYGELFSAVASAPSIESTSNQVAADMTDRMKNVMQSKWRELVAAWKQECDAFSAMARGRLHCLDVNALATYGEVSVNGDSTHCRASYPDGRNYREECKKKKRLFGSSRRCRSWYEAVSRAGERQQCLRSQLTNGVRVALDSLKAQMAPKLANMISDGDKSIDTATRVTQDQVHIKERVDQIKVVFATEGTEKKADRFSFFYQIRRKIQLQHALIRSVRQYHEDITGTGRKFNVLLIPALVISGLISLCVALIGCCYGAATFSFGFSSGLFILFIGLGVQFCVAYLLPLVNIDNMTD